MHVKRSRLALAGVLALALGVTLGLVSGSVADAKKKKHKKSNSVTISKSTSTPIPAGDGVNQIAGVASVPLTVGKKAKGKVVGFGSTSVTFGASGEAGQLDALDLKLIAPNGRTVFLDNPEELVGPGNDTSFGPLTETPDSPVFFCRPDPSPPPAGCPNGDPDNSLGPPFAGTAGEDQLALFNGGPAKGTWTLRVLNFSTLSTFVLSPVTLHISLITAPK